MNILVFAPHPDDEVIGCGGTVAQLAEQGHSVSVAYLTSGEAGNLNYSPMELQRTREAEALEGAEVLGITETHFLRFPDGGVTYSEETVTQITALLRETQPDVVFMPHQNDGHVDHQNAFRIIKEAVYRSGANAFIDAGEQPWDVGTVLAYEVWTPMTEFNYVSDISEAMGVKMSALRRHASQLSSVPYDDAIQGFNRYRGAMTGKGTYCECFQIIKLSAELWPKM